MLCVHLGERGVMGTGSQLNTRKGLPTVRDDGVAVGSSTGVRKAK